MDGVSWTPEYLAVRVCGGDGDATQGISLAQRDTYLIICRAILSEASQASPALLHNDSSALTVAPVAGGPSPRSKLQPSHSSSIHRTYGIPPLLMTSVGPAAVLSASPSLHAHLTTEEGTTPTGVTITSDLYSQSVLTD